MASASNGLPNLVVIPKGYAPLNADGMELANLAAWHLQRIGNSGMLAAPPEPSSSLPIGLPGNPAATQRRVWLEEPPGSIPFDEQGTINVPPVSVGTDVPVLTFTVPQGYDGVIFWISNNIPGITASRGDLIWKILINGRPVRNFGNIQQEKGTIAQGRQVSPIRLFSGDLVQYTIQHAAGVETGTTVCSLTGYYYPSKGIS